MNDRQEAKRVLMAHMYAISDRLLVTGMEVRSWAEQLKEHKCTEWDAFEGIQQAILTLFAEVGLTELAGKLFYFVIADLRSRDKVV